MKTIHRTEASATVTVSTVRLCAGWYETSLIVGGMVSDGRRSTGKAEAGLEHDAAVAFVRGQRDAASVRCAFWTRAMADLA